MSSLNSHVHESESLIISRDAQDAASGHRRAGLAAVSRLTPTWGRVYLPILTYELEFDVRAARKAVPANFNSCSVKTKFLGPELGPLP